MATKVSTGGIKTFHYQKGHEPKLKEEEKQEIRDAYVKYDERKVREKKNKIIIAIVIIIIILIIISVILF